MIRLTVRLAGLAMLMLAAFITTAPSFAQIPAEGIGDFNAVVEQVLKKERSVGKQILLDLYWGSVLDREPSFHDEFVITFLTDTNAIVILDKEALDTLVFLNDAWISAFLVDRERPVDRSVTDSAGITIIRETWKRPDSGLVRFEEYRSRLVGAELTRSRWTGPDGNISIDSTVLADNGMRTTYHFSIANGRRMQTSSSRTRTAEVIKGMHVPVQADGVNWCSLWTYALDRKGRIGRVDHYAFDLERGEMAEHDHLKIRYKR